MAKPARKSNIKGKKRQSRRSSTAGCKRGFFSAIPTLVKVGAALVPLAALTGIIAHRGHEVARAPPAKPAALVSFDDRAEAVLADGRRGKHSFESNLHAFTASAPKNAAVIAMPNGFCGKCHPVGALGKEVAEMADRAAANVARHYPPIFKPSGIIINTGSKLEADGRSAFGITDGITKTGILMDSAALADPVVGKDALEHEYVHATATGPQFLRQEPYAHAFKFVSDPGLLFRLQPKGSQYAYNALVSMFLERAAALGGKTFEAIETNYRPFEAFRQRLERKDVSMAASAFKQGIAAYARNPLLWDAAAVHYGNALIEVDVEIAKRKASDPRVQAILSNNTKRNVAVKLLHAVAAGRPPGSIAQRAERLTAVKTAVDARTAFHYYFMRFNSARLEDADPAYYAALHHDFRNGVEAAVPQQVVMQTAAEQYSRLQKSAEMLELMQSNSQPALRGNALVKNAIKQRLVYAREQSARLEPYLSRKRPTARQSK